jgi:type IV pilus assembly protein PilZ
MNMQAEVRRSDPRVRANLKVRFKNAESFITEYTQNISKGGVFIRTTSPCNPQDRVELALVLPEDDSEIQAAGKVVHVVTADQATEQTPAGMGIQILDLKKEDQEKIVGFINSKLDQGPDTESRREHVRVETRIRLRFKNKETLLEQYIDNISQGGIFIATSAPKPVGDQIALILIHPETGEELLLHGEVVRVVDGKDRAPGMGIQFHSMNGFLRKQLDEFIQEVTSGIPLKALILEEY